MNAIMGQNLRYSNFLITVSTNVTPNSIQEMGALTQWLIQSTSRLFGSWDYLNGRVLKPPGTPNSEMRAFPADHSIISVRSKIAVEEGGVLGQMHAHILLEVAHEYTRQRDGAEGYGNETGRPYLGVHTNVLAMREFFNARIQDMDLEDARKPGKIYVNSKLLTKGTDNSNKWLTLQYLNKDVGRDNGGGYRNLRFDEAVANNAEDSNVRSLLLRRGENNTVEPEHRAPSPEPEFDLEVAASPPLLRPAPFPPRFVHVNRPPAQPPRPPGMRVVTSAANVGLPRLTRGRPPGKYK